MSITPSTSEISYTVVGGVQSRERKELPGLSVVLLNRGGSSFPQELFDELCKLQVREIISVETSPCSYDVEDLYRKHDNLCFILFTGSADLGSCIDAAVREALSDHVFVLWSDMNLVASSISSRVFFKIAERNRLCTVPQFKDSADRFLPTVLGPRPGGRRFDVQPVMPADGETATLCPWDYSGIYRRKRHMGIGGYDSAITEPWWQKLEYGMRAWLWGEELRTHPALRLSYTDEPPAEDSSPGPDYRRFFLKTLAVRFQGDSGRLPLSRYFAYRRDSGESRAAVRRTWGDVRNWVDRNATRFVRDAVSLTELWDWGEG